MNESAHVEAAQAGVLEPAGLGREACLRLLATRRTGRVLFTEAAMPAALPARYVIEGDAVVFRSASTSLLARTAVGRVLGFQVDDLDSESAIGWTVLGLGQAYEIADPGVLAALAGRMQLRPAGDVPMRTLGIPLQRLTGSYLRTNGPLLLGAPARNE